MGSLGGVGVRCWRLEIVEWVGIVIGIVVVCLAVGFVVGRALFLVQLGKNGYDVRFDGGKESGRGRYRIKRK